MNLAISERYANGCVIFELLTDITEMYVVKQQTTLLTKYVLVWGDYVANVWEEEFMLLSTTMARLATLIHVVEKEQVGVTIGLHDYTEWSKKWEEIVSENTDTIDYEAKGE